MPKHPQVDPFSEGYKGYGGGAPAAPHTVADLHTDRATALGMTDDEYTEYLEFRHDPGSVCDEKMSPERIDDGDGYGA